MQSIKVQFQMYLHFPVKSHVRFCVCLCVCVCVCVCVCNIQWWAKLLEHLALSYFSFFIFLLAITIPIKRTIAVMEGICWNIENDGLAPQSPDLNLIEQIWGELEINWTDLLYIQGKPLA